MDRTIWAAVVALLLLAPAAYAATPACGATLSSDTTYVFDSDLICDGGGWGSSIIYIDDAHDVTIDCASFRIINNGTRVYGIKIGTSNKAARNISVKNCEIVNISDGSRSKGIYMMGTSETVQNDNITIVNTSISLDTTDQNYMGIAGVYSNNVTIRNVTVNAGGDGIEMSSVSDLLVTGCDLHGSTSGNGVQVLSWGMLDGYNASGAVIEDCDISGYGSGVQDTYYNGMTVRNNRLTGNRDGVNVFGETECVDISHNEIRSNSDSGINIYDRWVAPNRGLTISHNNITNNNDGIHMIDGLEDAVISFNNVTNNSMDGISAEISWTRSSNVTLLNNTVCGNNQDGGDYYDIKANEKVAGDNNTCETTSDYADGDRFTGCETSCSGCVDSDGDGSYVDGGACGPADCNDCDAGILTPRENMLLTWDAKLCPGTYYLNDTERDGAIKLSGSDITLDCNGAALIGNYTTGSNFPHAIVIMFGGNVTVKNCNLSWYGTGIGVQAYDVKILNNTLTNIAYSVSPWGQDELTMIGNTITEAMYGVSLGFSRGSVIRDNVFQDVVVSVAINRGCEDNIVEDNTIHSSITAFTGPIITQDFAPRRSYGIRMTSRDWEATENNTLHNNTINGSDYCILLNASEDGSIDFNDIEGNNLTNCTFGIYINVASGNSFQSNWVCGSDDTDIYVESKSGTDTGDGNTCQTVRGWSDLTAGPTGCTNWCSPVEVEPEEEEEKDKKTRGSGSYYMTGTTLAPPLPPPPQEEEPPAQPPAEPKLELQIVGTPEAGGEITIIVTDQDGNPVPGAEVTVDGETYTTDEDGRVTVELGEAGVLAIDASLPGYEGTQLNIQVKEAPEEPSAAGQAEQPKPRAEPPADYTLPIIVLVVIIGGVLMYIFFLRR